LSGAGSVHTVDKLSETSSIPATAARRNRALKLTVASSLGAKVLSIACTFTQVPIALHYLGREAYGLWITLVSLLMVLNFVDFGVGVGMQHAMATAYGADDRGTLRRTFWTGASFLGVLSLVALVIGLPLALALRWEDLLHVENAALRANSRAALTITVAAFAIGLPFNAVSRLAAAVQRGWWHSLWIAIGSVLSLAAVALSAWLDLGFLIFLAVALLVPVIQGLGLYLHLCRELGWSVGFGGLIPSRERNAIARQSLLFALPQAGLALLQTMPAVAIATTSGAAAVTAFNLLMRLLSPIQQGQIMFLTPLWPAYTEAHVRGESHWVHRMLVRSVGFTLYFAAGAGIVGLCSPWLLRVWVGAQASQVPTELVIAACLWCVVQLLAQPLIYFLVGLGELRALSSSTVPGFALTAVMLFLPGLHTAAGVLGAAAAGFVVALLPPLTIATVRRARGLREIPSVRP
jgi:O-antigen/teichoic acid export membrane protein